jgi:hypothetical protein
MQQMQVGVCVCVHYHYLVAWGEICRSRLSGLVLNDLRITVSGRQLVIWKRWQSLFNDVVFL